MCVRSTSPSTAAQGRSFDSAGAWILAAGTRYPIPGTRLHGRQVHQQMLPPRLDLLDRSPRDRRIVVHARELRVLRLEARHDLPGQCPVQRTRRAEDRVALRHRQVERLPGHRIGARSSSATSGSASTGPAASQRPGRRCRGRAMDEARGVAQLQALRRGDEAGGLEERANRRVERGAAVHLRQEHGCRPLVGVGAGHGQHPRQRVGVAAAFGVVLRQPHEQGAQSACDPGGEMAVDEHHAGADAAGRATRARARQAHRATSRVRRTGWRGRSPTARRRPRSRVACAGREAGPRPRAPRTASPPRRSRSSRAGCDRSPRACGRRRGWR